MVRSAESGRYSKVAAAGIAWYAGIYVGLGTPVFIGLLILAMFTCGTSEKWPSQSSAYSVFNGGEQIAGTLSARQIDEQMRNGGHARRAAATPAESTFMQSALRGWGGGSTTVPVQGGVRAEVSQADLRLRRAAQAEAAEKRATQGLNQAPHVQ